MEIFTGTLRLKKPYFITEPIVHVGIDDWVENQLKIAYQEQR